MSGTQRPAHHPKLKRKQTQEKHTHEILSAQAFFLHLEGLQMLQRDVRRNLVLPHYDSV